MRPLWQIEQFQAALNYCKLSLIIFYGLNLTCANNCGGGGFIKEKLDHVVANHPGMALLSGSSYSILPQLKSYHSPLFINIVTFEVAAKPRTKLFHYEATWQLKEECSQVIKTTWSLQLLFPSTLRFNNVERVFSNGGKF